MDQFNELLYKFIKRPAHPIKCPVTKVLIIDDNPDIQRALGKTLSQMNYDVIVKTTGKDGIESLTEEISVAEDIDTLYLSIEKAAKGNKRVKR